MSYFPERQMIQGVFGDSVTSPLVPHVTLKSTYGLLDECSTLTYFGGSATSLNNEFVCSTGTSVGGFATILSRRPVVYIPGLGAEARITLRCSTPVANSIQMCGFFTASDGLFAGYQGTQFGVSHRFGGRVELRAITVTTPSSSSVNVNITVDGVNYVVPVTSTTAQNNAHEIEIGLLQTSLSEVWFIQHIDNTVVLTAKTDGPRSGSYSIVPVSGTLVANVAQVWAGLSATENFTPQSSWNVDKCLWLDPLKGNIFKFEYAYLGYGCLKYSVFNPITRSFVLCHSIDWTNSNTTVNLGNPSLRVGWVAQSRGSSSNLSVYGGSAMAGLQGKASRLQSFGAYGVSTGVTTESQLLSIQVRREFGGRANLGIVLPKILTLSTDSTKGAVFKIYISPTVNGNTIHNYVNQVQSICTYDTAGTTVSGGKLLSVYSVGPQGRITIDLDPLKYVFVTGDEIVITSQVTSGAASEMTASMTWEEVT